MTDEEIRKQLEGNELTVWDHPTKFGNESWFLETIAEERRRRKIAEEAEELLYDDLVRSSKSFEEYEREAEARLRSRGEL